jgi:hypothetical protein
VPSSRVPGWVAAFIGVDWVLGPEVLLVLAAPSGSFPGCSNVGFEDTGCGSAIPRSSDTRLVDELTCLGSEVDLWVAAECDWVLEEAVVFGVRTLPFLWQYLLPPSQRLQPCRRWT